MNIVKSALLPDNKLIKVAVDECPDDPFNEWDNFTHIVAWHRNYLLGNKKDRQEFPDPDSFHEFLKENKNKVLVLNLYMYEHSGISLSVDQSRPYPYNCRWDSSSIGYVYVTYQEIKENFMVKKVTKNILQRAIKLIESEIDTYNHYLNGSCYYYELYNVKKSNLGCEHQELIDSLSGIYGYDNIDHVISDNTGIDTTQLEWTDGDIEDSIMEFA